MTPQRVTRARRVGRGKRLGILWFSRCRVNGNVDPATCRGAARAVFRQPVRL